MSDRELSAEQRKKDHIQLTFESQMAAAQLDPRFNYEPMTSAHPVSNTPNWPQIKVAGKTVSFPLWISSMTGGTTHAADINANLAKAGKKFGMGMGLGSCRALLDNDDHLADFNVRSLIGEDQPLFANLGIAQIEGMLKRGETAKIESMLDRLSADGLIVHVNPLQEWFQPEGDVFSKAPIDTVKSLLSKASYPIIVKEVGQGMGPRSVKELLQLPIEALDFGAAGGTNFSLLEALRSDNNEVGPMTSLTKVGHSAFEMVDMVNDILLEIGDKRKCDLIIVSGGMKDFLDGYYCMKKLKIPALFAQASALLKRALISDTELYAYLENQRRGLQMAYQFLDIKE
jgi:isopentenyl-diphosphate delta-isomerase